MEDSIEALVEERVSALEFLVRDQQDLIAGLIDSLQRAEIIELASYDRELLT